MIVEFDQIFKDLICEDIHVREMKSVEDRGGYLKKHETGEDPWDGEKPHAKDGFVVKYCVEY